MPRQFGKRRRLPTHESEESDTENEKEVGNGLLADFLQRVRARQKTKQGIGRLLKRETLLFLDEPNKKGKKDKKEEKATLVEAEVAVQRERLHAALRGHVTSFWKARGDPAWVCNGKAFCERAAMIVAYKRQALCLDDEIKCWLKKLNLSTMAVAEIGESSDERHKRLQNFFSKFHASPSRTEHCRAAGSSIQASDQRPGRRAIQAERDSPALPPISEASCGAAPPASSDAWQTRGARGCRRAPAFATTVASFQKAHMLRELPAERPTSKWAAEAETTYTLGGRHEFPKSVHTVSLPDLPSRVSPSRRLVDDGRATTCFKAVANSRDTRRQPGMKREAQSLPSLHSTRNHKRPELPVTSVAAPAFVTTVASFHKTQGAASPSVLPPLTATFSSPWRGSKADGAFGRPASPVKQYLSQCEASLVVPCILPFATGHSMKIQAGGHALMDNDLLAVAMAFKCSQAVEEVDLRDNSMLTERSLIPFLEKLFSQPASSSLRALCLRQCLRHSPPSSVQSTIETVVGLLQHAVNLRHLDLSGIPFAVKSHHPICVAIKNHPFLETVGLADTGLTSATAKNCVGELLRSRSLQVLDLGWNCFSSDVFSCLGTQVVESKFLKSLSLSNCSAASKKTELSQSAESDNPITYFMEHLGRDKTLTQLDLSLNRIDFRGALVLEDALEYHQKLSRLDISQNPLGIMGLRSLVRALCSDRSGLMHFACEDCGGNSETEGQQVFSATDPGARYCLDLSRTYHRAVLRMLYKSCDRFGLAPDVAFTQTSFSKPPYNHATKGPDGDWQVGPTAGVLRTTFSIDQALEAATKGITEQDFCGFLDRHKKLMRLRPSFKKIVPLFAEWRKRSLEGKHQSQLQMLAALSKDFLITYPHLQQMCCNRSITSDVISHMLPCLDGGDQSRFLGMLLTPSLGEYVKMLRWNRNLLMFNAENPTGHYRLDLGNSTDGEVAEQLLLLDRWEGDIARRQGRFDTSQRGNRSFFRSELYQQRPLQREVEMMSDWRLPEVGILEFDYISGKRPPAEAPALSERAFSSILGTIQTAPCSHSDQIEALRVISHSSYWTCLQVRELMGLFPEQAIRAEIFIVLFLRIMDIQNEKVLRSRFESKQDVWSLRHRLGHTTYFPFIQPAQLHFKYNFAVHDQRLAANILLNLSTKEGRGNVRNPTYIMPDGTEDPLTQGIYRSWDSFDKMPKEGVLSGSYCIAADDRCFEERRRLMASFGFWKLNVPEEDVYWCSEITDVPEDVLEYVEFLVAFSGDVNAAFKFIDGPGGNGQITMREFEQGVQSMRCRKFRGDREAERIQAVFRYLDPGQEGQISPLEWGVLGQLFNEVRLCVKEFVSFLQRKLGRDLDKAWDFLDDDDSGQISFAEWSTGVRDMGFFGPSKPIFSFLDKNEEGRVSKQEFKALDEFCTEVEEA